MGPSAFRHSTVPSWKPHHKVHSSITFWLVKNNDVTIYNPLTTVDFFLKRLLEHWWWIPQPRLPTNSVTSYLLEAKTLLIMIIKSVRSHNLYFFFSFFILSFFTVFNWRHRLNSSVPELNWYGSTYGSRVYCNYLKKKNEEKRKKKVQKMGKKLSPYNIWK